MTFTDDDLKRLKEDISTPFEVSCTIAPKIPALLARLEAAELCALGLAAWDEHQHVYWSNPDKSLPRCPGHNSIDECDTTMVMRRQFKVTLAAWRKACGK
jgi:hypothetical protein